MTACAVVRAGGGDQVAVVRGNRQMGDIPRSGMAGGAIAAAGRNTGLQDRNGCMAEGAISTMGDINRCIGGTTWIVTACT
jgi:hypothetical protein